MDARAEVGVAVVGTGFGTRVHVPALRAAGFVVHALVGRDHARTARRAQRLAIEHACTSLDDALALPGVDAVTVATPPASHAPLASAAIAAGRHVLCEKPFTLDAAEARALAAEAQSAGVVALVGHEFRWDEGRATLARALADGLVGSPRLATLVSYVPLVADPAAPVPPWWFDPAAGGGWLGASGSHLVDQTRVWLGEVAAVSATMGMTSDRDERGDRDGSDVHAEDTFTARLTTADGCAVAFQQTAGAWGPMVQVTRVAGTRGTLWLDGSDVWLADATGTRQLAVPGDLRLPDAPAPSDDPRHRFTHLELGPYTRLAEAFRERILGQPSSSAISPATFDDGVACMEVLDAMRRSTAAGGDVVHLRESGAVRTRG